MVGSDGSPGLGVHSEDTIWEWHGSFSAFTTSPAVLKWIEQIGWRHTLSSILSSVSKPKRVGIRSLNPWAGGV